MSFFISETIFSDANIAIKNGRIRFNIRLITTSFFVIKSIAIYKFNLTQLFILEKKFSDTNIVIKKKKIKYFTHIIITFIFAAKSIASYKANLLTLIFIENIILKNTITVELFLSSISLLTYRAMSPSSLIYETVIKFYLIIVDLYMHYASFKFIKSTYFKFTITRFMIIMLSIIFMQDLYEKFYNKKKLIILTSSKIFNFSIN